MADEFAFDDVRRAVTGIARYVCPRKDGVLAGLLYHEIVARCGKSLSQQLQERFAEVGSFYSVRENFHLTPEVKEKFTGKLHGEPRDLMGPKVTEVVRTDGL